MKNVIIQHCFRLFSRWGFLAFVVLPVALTLIFSLFIAQNRYACESQVLIRENRGSTSAAVPGLAFGLLGGMATSIEDAYVLRDYLLSGYFALQIADKFDLRSHYSDSGMDFIHSIDKDASQEDFLAFYRDQLSIQISPDSSIVTLRAVANSPETALSMNEYMLAQSENQINELNNIMARAKTGFAEKELALAEEALLKTEKALLTFQHKNSFVDADSEASSLVTRITALEAEQTLKEAELKRLRQFMREDAIPILALQQEIQALENQLNEEDAELTGSPDGSLLPLLQQFQRLRLEVEFATQAYTSAFAALETAKVEAARQEKFILTVAKPILPEEPFAPSPIKDPATILVICLLVYGIIRLLLATISDHMI